MPGSGLDALAGSRPAPNRRVRTPAPARGKPLSATGGFFAAIQSVGASGPGSAVVDQTGDARVAATGSKGCSARLSDTVKVWKHFAPVLVPCYSVFDACGPVRKVVILRTAFSGGISGDAYYVIRVTFRSNGGDYYIAFVAIFIAFSVALAKGFSCVMLPVLHTVVWLQCIASPGL